MDGFDNGMGAGYVQNESADAADLAMKAAVTRGENIVIPKIGGYSSISEIVALLKENGYSINLFFNDVPTDVSVMRAASRYAQTGRFLSIDYLMSIGEKARDTFERFRDAGVFDYMEWRDNNVPYGQEAKLIEAIGRDRYDQGQSGLRRPDMGDRSQYQGLEQAGTGNVPGGGTSWNSSSYRQDSQRERALTREVPAQNSGNRRVSRSALTARDVARENNQTEAENAIEENIAADREGYTYTPKSNRETEEQAWANREARWHDEDRLTGLFEQVESAQGAELDNLTTELILEYVDAVNSGDMARASRIQEQRGKLGTVIGRALQTNTLLRKLTPEGFLNDATAKMNRDYARRNGFSPTKINDEVRESMKGQEEEIVREAAEALAGGDVDVLIKFLE